MDRQGKTKRVTRIAPILVVTLAALLVGSASAIAQEASPAPGADELQAGVLEEGQVQTIVQVGELEPAPEGAVPSGWETEWSQLIGADLLAQLDSSGDAAWDSSEHPLVYISAQGPGYGSAAFGGAFLSGAQVGPGVAIIDATTHEAVASTEYLVDDIETYSENHGLGVSMDGKWLYTQGANTTSDLRGNGVLLVINAETLKIDKIIRSRVHHARNCYNAFTDKHLVLVDGWGTFFALDPTDDNRIAGAVDPADLRGSGYLGFCDPSGQWLITSVRTGFRESDGGIAVISLEDWKVKARLNTHDGSPIWVTYDTAGEFAYVSNGHESRIAQIDMRSESPAEWRVVGMANSGAIGPYGLTFNWDDSILYAMGKGEASHNQGKTVGFTNPDLFSEPDQYRGWGTTMGQIVSNCLRQDHSIVHPDPELNEMWISCNSSFDNVVIDMGSQTVKGDPIPQPNGGSSHNGAFVQYDADGNGEVLSDTGGLWGSARETKEAIVAEMAAEDATAAAGS